MRSSYAPGPVLVSVETVGDMGIAYQGNETYKQSRYLSVAEVSQGSYAWAIGPAIAPGTDEAGLRKLIDKWVAEGLGFLWPVADKAKPLADELAGVTPSCPFEKQALESLVAFVGRWRVKGPASAG